MSTATVSGTECSGSESNRAVLPVAAQVLASWPLSPAGKSDPVEVITSITAGYETSTCARRQVCFTRGLPVKKVAEPQPSFLATLRFSQAQPWLKEARHQRCTHQFQAIDGLCAAPVRQHVP
jgi:hypothetical protein